MVKAQSRWEQANRLTSKASERDAFLLERPPQSLPNDNSKYPDFLKK